MKARRAARRRVAVGAPTRACFAGRAPAGPLVAAEAAGEAHRTRVVACRAFASFCSAATVQFVSCTDCVVERLRIAH